MVRLETTRHQCDKIGESMCLFVALTTWQSGLIGTLTQCSSLVQGGTTAVGNLVNAVITTRVAGTKGKYLVCTTTESQFTIVERL